jgi:hypothetical protein
MIRHIVLIRFRTDVAEEKIGQILSALGPLCARLGAAFVVGRSESPEKIERGYLHGFTIDFASWEALATYAEDPAHKAFGGQLVAHAQGGIDGILVFDLPC